MTILDDILLTKKQEVEAAKKRCSLAEMISLARATPPARNFLKALEPLPTPSGMRPRVIAECKRKSPSRGVMRDPYDPVAIAKSYAANGAAAISVLTDEQFFGGQLRHLIDVVDAVPIPVLRKDFIIDEYQVYEARAAGADSFLLLAGPLDTAALQYLIEVGREFEMEPLVEAHNSHELAVALATDALIIGINNRNLRDFSVSFDQASLLLKQARQTDLERIVVCESGIKSSIDIVRMTGVGYNAFLIGESLVTTPDPGKSLNELISNRPPAQN